MSVQNRLIATSAVFLFLTSGGMVDGQTDTSSDRPSEVISGRLSSDGDVMRARARVNPLTAPDTSQAFAETDDGHSIRGVMTKDGPVDDTNNLQRDFGSFGIPYTTARVQEGNRSTQASDANRLSTTYPYRALGRLTYINGGISFACSASVIARSIILTAAHCVQDLGDGDVYFTNFRFRPGHYGASGATAEQISPYGAWSPFLVMRAGSWGDGTDVGSGAARENDLALLAMQKLDGQFIGDVVGWFNYSWNNYSFVSSPKTGDLLTAAVTTLGYPGLLDLGRIMQRVDGPTYPTTVSDAPQLWQGSNLTGGASGGPWVVNFAGRNAALSGGATNGNAPIMTIVGVTSWGSPNPNSPKDNYSSQFGQNSRYPQGDYGGYGAGNIGSLMNTLCTFDGAPEGGTLESQGYCF